MARGKKQTAGDAPASAENSITTESKEDKLRRLASKRVSRAVRDIELVGNLAAYGPTKEQAERILKALVDSLNGIAPILKGEQRRGGGRFSL